MNDDALVDTYSFKASLIAIDGRFGKIIDGMYISNRTAEDAR